MNINVQIQLIQINENIVHAGQLNGAEFRMEFTPIISQSIIQSISVRWTFQVNISSNQYVIHRSTTTFICPEFPFDNNILNDMRLQLLSELGQISQAHSRVLFIRSNNTNQIPLFRWRQHLKEEIARQLRAYLN